MLCCAVSVHGSREPGNDDVDIRKAAATNQEIEEPTVEAGESIESAEKNVGSRPPRQPGTVNSHIAKI